MDTKMGRRSNCRSVIGVLTGVCDYHDLAQESDFIVESLSEALPLFLDTHQHSSSFYASKKPSLFHKENSKKTFTQTRSYSTVNIGTVERKEFTHVIVGAGSAGCTLANRLTEDANNSVLLLEAGPRDTVLNTKRLLWTIHMPAALMYNLCHDKYNWYYNTIPQKHMDNRSMYWPRGRVWGGSSSLNAMVYIRGHAEDYNRWHREGATGWDYDHCLPYFKKAQNHQLGGDTYRGGNGPLHVSQGDVSHPLHAAFLKGGQQAGYPYTSDMNGYQQEGVGPMDMTIHRGLRWNTASAYLRPALNRDNLTTEVNCLTTKVLFDGKKAIGVEVLNRGKLREFYASNEVILSGGAINSPQLLMISGVGNADDLRPLGITVAHHLPGVGQNLQDHLELYVQHKCKKPITLYNDQQPVQMLKVGVEWMLQLTGQAATAHLHTGGFIRSEAGMPHPDVQYHFLPSQVIDHGRIAPEFHGYQAHVGTLRETSRGSMKLKSRSPYEHPILDPNYLATEEDVVALRNSVKLTREIFQQKAFDEFRGDEVLPGPSIQTDSEIDAFVRQNCQTAYHPSCTCKMGHEDDPMAVVDNETKVIGMENLRIVDSSIMPSIISGNLNAPTIMIAERAADIIRGQELLYMPNTPVYKPENQSSQR